MTFAAIVLGAAFSVTGLIIWLIIGLIAGFLASRIMGAGGYGIVGDIILGLVAACIGGWLVNLLIPDANLGFIARSIVATICAVDLISVLRNLRCRAEWFDRF